MHFWAASKPPHLTAFPSLMPCLLTLFCINLCAFSQALNFRCSFLPHISLWLSSLSVWPSCPDSSSSAHIPGLNNSTAHTDTASFLNFSHPHFLYLALHTALAVAQSIYKVLRLEAMSYVSFGSGLFIVKDKIDGCWSGIKVNQMQQEFYRRLFSTVQSWAWLLVVPFNH